MWVAILILCRTSELLSQSQGTSYSLQQSCYKASHIAALLIAVVVLPYKGRFFSLINVSLLHVFSTNLVYWFIQNIFVHSGGVLSFIFIEHEFHLPIVCRGITQFSINLLETCQCLCLLSQVSQRLWNAFSEAIKPFQTTVKEN